MKLLRLDLLAYGPFTRRSLEFLAAGPNFHIVYGPNEAGKSTTLRAITGFFYGIETQTSDAHLHAMSELRIGATLLHSNGDTRTFVRKKGNRATLLDSKEANVDEAVLRAWLSISDRKHFEQMFGLSHEQLRHAGAALADPKTDLGKMLFGASLDGTTLHRTLQRLDADAEKLLSSGGNAGSITKSLVAYRERLARMKALAAPPKDWLSISSEIDAATVKQQQLIDEKARCRAERHRLERLLRALPWLRLREAAQRELLAVGEQARLPRDIEHQRNQLELAVEHAEETCLRTSRALERASRDRDELEVNEAIVGASIRIRSLVEHLGKHKTEQRDYPGVQKEIITYRNEQREHLRRIGWGDVDTRNLGNERIDDASLARVRSLAQEELKRQSSLQLLLESGRKKRSLVARQLDDLTAQAKPQDTTALRAIWEYLRPDKRLADNVREAETQLAELDAGCGAALPKLAPWRGALTEALALPVLPEDVIRDFDRTFEHEERSRNEITKRIGACELKLTDIRSSISSVVAAGEPSSVERVANARSLRERVWRRVLIAWRSGVAPSLPDPETHPGESLEMEYVASVRSADELADELNRDARRAAELLGFRRTEEALASELVACQRELHEIDERIQQRNDEWRRLWLACGFEPLRPRDMLRWRAEHSAIVEQAHRRNERAAKLEALRATMQEQTHTIEHALNIADASPGTMSWLALLVHAEQTLKTASARDESRKLLQHNLSNDQRQLEEIEEQLVQYQNEQAAWRNLWREAVAKLRLPEDALIEQAHVVMDGLAEIFRLEASCERQEARLRAIEKEMAKFDAAVKALVDELAPALTGTSIERADALDRLHTTATKNAERRRTIDEQIVNLAREHEDAALALNTARQRLDALLQSVGCRDLAELDVEISRTNQARQIEARKVDAEKHLADVGEGWSLEALEEAARDTDSDQLSASMAALDEGLKALESEHDEHHKAQGALEERKKRFSGSDDAAVVLGEAHQLLAHARADAERYARLRLGSALLRKAIENYRQKNEGAILRRAGALFERLTLGRYQGLHVEYEGDRAKLICARGSEMIDVKHGLSDGTLDQLYLSLRLASLEQHLGAQEPMPLVLDDIFIHFDDERARAGLEVLAEFARTTQILLLTHHERNLDLARSSLAPGSWTEHRFALSNNHTGTPT